ncbi:hypothetical protein Scep_029852 [Stephania cephalantha]|uniref:Uncharacterized protein n=1 Tax=Stephania cephalantha TaxID=152367 RepID=A0AAP0DYI2_9MAGN
MFDHEMFGWGSSREMFGWGSPVNGSLSFDPEMFGEVIVMGSSRFSYVDSQMSTKILR